MTSKSNGKQAALKQNTVPVTTLSPEKPAETEKPHEEGDKKTEDAANNEESPKDTDP